MQWCRLGYYYYGAFRVFMTVMLHFTYVVKKDNKESVCVACRLESEKKKFHLDLKVIFLDASYTLYGFNMFSNIKPGPNISFCRPITQLILFQTGPETGLTVKPKPSTLTMCSPSPWHPGLGSLRYPNHRWLIGPFSSKLELTPSENKTASSTFRSISLDGFSITLFP